MAHESAVANCRPGPGRDRALRSIYFTVLSFKNVGPPRPRLEQNPRDNHLRFLDNRARYIKGLEMRRYEFSDWKYYLHYTLARDYNYLIKASEQWPQSGRLIA